MDIYNVKTLRKKVTCFLWITSVHDTVNNFRYPFDKNTAATDGMPVDTKRNRLTGACSTKEKIANYDR